MKRLKKATGTILKLSSAPASKSSSGEASLVKKALLIHSGENGSEIVLESADGEISFDMARIKNIVKCHNAYIDGLKAEYGGDDKMPIGAYPPILDQHEDDSSFRICGRLSGRLEYKVMDVPGVGKNCSVAICDITFLGADVVERVEDGRLYHLSIGIDENTDTLTETSLVIEPAAPGAMLLKKGNTKMSKDLKRLEAHKKRKTTLSAIRESVKGLSAKVTTANSAVKLAKKQGEVTHRLTGLMRSGKLTPAEYKKMDVKKLAKLADEQLNTVLETFAALEPKVLVGQHGSTAAADFSSIGKSMKSKEIKNLKAEVRRDIMRLSGKKVLKEEDEDDDEKKLSSFADENAKKLAGLEKPVEGVQDEDGGMVKHLEMMKEVSAHLEAGDLDKAKEAHLAAMKHCEGLSSSSEKHLEMGDENHEEVSKSNDELQKQIDEVTTQVSRISSMIEELYSVEEEEGHDLEKGDDEDEKKLALEKEEEAKKLAASDEEEKKRLAKEMGTKEE